MSGQLYEGSQGRLAFAVLAVFFSFVGQEYSDEGWALWYQTVVFGVPVQYLVFAGMIFMLWPILRHRPHVNVTGTLQETALWRWVVLGWITVIVALVLSVLRQAAAPFADWRNFVILATTAIIVAKLVADRSWRQYVLTDLSIGYGLLSGVYLIIWLGGGGTQLFDVRIPLYDGYELALAVFSAAVAAEAWIRGFPGMAWSYSVALRLSLLMSTAVVLFSFRRTLWAYVVLTLIGLGVWGIRTGRSRRRQAAKLLGAVVALAATVVITLGPTSVSERLASFNPFATNPYTTSNEDHVNDIRDALTVIADEPLLGLGIGSTYKTDLIAEWKTESFQVHNAFLHSWLKFGLLGLITYIGFHIALGIAYLRLGARGAIGFSAAGIALFAEQVDGLIQTWPYEGFGYTIFRGIVLGVFVATVHSITIAGRPRLDPAMPEAASETG